MTRDFDNAVHSIEITGLEKLREVMRKGDVIVVWRLDRLERSLRHLIDVMAQNIALKFRQRREKMEHVRTFSQLWRAIFSVF